MVLPAAASAKTFTVNKRGDHAPGKCTKKDCTLREAVIAATDRTGNDKIKLPSRKTYKLKRSRSLAGPDETKGDLNTGAAVEKGNNLTIGHPGKGRAKIGANGAEDRAIHALGGLKLVKVVVRGGFSPLGEPGGGIRAAGVLVLIKSRVRGNDAGFDGGGVSIGEGRLVVRRTLITGNTATEGGGIYVDSAARLRLVKSTVSGNEAILDDGGGIAIHGGSQTGRISSSTIARNETVGDGGGVLASADDLRVVNSTLTKNRARGRGGGLHAEPDSHAELNAVAIARNRADSDDGGPGHTGGGIYADGGAEVVAIQNTLLAKNRHTGAALNDCFAPSPPNIDSLGGSIFTSASGDCDGDLDHPEDFGVANPMIGPLKDNGGPTETISLRAGSPAINEADGPSPPSSDQRGKARSNPDIGAYER